MFGGGVIKSNGVQVGVITDNQFYFKTTEDLREKYRKRGSKLFTYKNKGKWVTVHAWYLAPEEVIDNLALFLGWAEETIGVQR